MRSNRAQKVADALAAEEAREQDKQKRQQQRQAARKGQQPKGARRDASAAKHTATVTAAEPMQAVSAEAATALGPAAGTGARGAAPAKGSESDSDGKPASPGWRITAGREATASRLECELAAAQSLHFAPRASQNSATGKLATAQRLLLPTEPNKSQAAGMLEAELAAAQSLCLPPRASQSPARGKPAGAAAAEAMGSPAGGSAKHVLAPENKARPATSLDAFFPPEQATAASPTGQHGQRGPGRGDSGASETPLAQAAHPQDLRQGGPEWQPVSRSERKRKKKRAVRAAAAGPAADQGPADAQPHQAAELQQLRLRMSQTRRQGVMGSVAASGQAGRRSPPRHPFCVCSPQVALLSSQQQTAMIWRVFLRARGGQAGREMT